MSPDNPLQPTTAQQTTNPPVTTNQPTTIAQPLPVPPQPKQRSKIRIVVIIILAIITVMLLIGILTYTAYRSEKSAGLQRAAQHVALLEANNVTALKSEAIAMLGVDENTTDPNEQEKIVLAGTQIGFLTTILTSADSVQYDDAFTVNADGKKVVTAYYKVTVQSSKTVYYSVSVRKDADKWVLHAIEVSQTDPLLKK